MATINGRFDFWSYAYGRDDGMADTLYGTSSGDNINGFGGNDWLFGNGGNDTINAGMGNDWIVGGSGTDYMTGGQGRDTFSFSYYDSLSSYSTADVIKDFNSYDDAIYLTGNTAAGNAFNYREGVVYGTGNSSTDFNIALAHAQYDIKGSVQYAFYTNGTNGYFFADMDKNGVVDTGIELKGLNELSDFSFSDIV